MQETQTLHQSTPTPTPTPFPPPLSRPKHLHCPSTPYLPPLPKHPLLINSNSNPNSNPNPLLKSPSGPLQEKLLYLDSLGIDSLHCLSTHPQLIQTPLLQIKSTLHFLRTIPLTKHDINRSVSMCPDILTSSIQTTLIPAITFLLRDAHVDPSNLRHVIHRRPRLLTSSVHRTLRPALIFLRDVVGVDDVSKWAPLLSASVEAKLLPRIRFVEELGVERREALEMFRRFPALFCYSVEANIEPKVEFLVGEMGREVGEFVAFPQYFSFSLENRIKVRHRMCVEKGVCLELPVMLKASEVRFKELLEVSRSSSSPMRTSPFWCTSSAGVLSTGETAGAG